MKNLIIEKINSIVQKNHDDYQKKVQKVFSNLKPHRELKYAIENQLTFRVLLLFWDPVTNSQSRSFIERFYSNERQVACSGYHTYSADGTMASYLEEGLQAGDEKILQDTGNIGKRVSFDEKGFPTLHDAKVKILGTNSWMVGNFSFSEECCEMKGYEYSEDKPALKKTSYVRFNRI